MAFGRCDYGTMEWYCVLRDGHDGPHRSEVLVDPASLSDDERRAMDLPIGPVADGPSDATGR